MFLLYLRINLFHYSSTFTIMKSVKRSCEKYKKEMNISTVHYYPPMKVLDIFLKF